MRITIDEAIMDNLENKLKNCEQKFEKCLKENSNLKETIKQQDQKIQEWKDTALKNTANVCYDMRSKFFEIYNNENNIVNMIDNQIEKTNAQYRVMQLMGDDIFKTEKYRKRFKQYVIGNSDPIEALKEYNKLVVEEKIYMEGYNDGQTNVNKIGTV